MRNLTFNSFNFTPIRQNNQIWLTSAELAKALGYSRVIKLTTSEKSENLSRWSPNFSRNTETVLREKIKKYLTLPIKKDRKAT